MLVDKTGYNILIPRMDTKIAKQILSVLVVN